MPWIPIALTLLALTVAYILWNSSRAPDKKEQASRPPAIPIDARPPPHVSTQNAAAPVSMLTKDGHPSRFDITPSSLMSAALPPHSPSELATLSDRLAKWKAAHDQLITALAARKITVPETSSDIDPNITRLLGMNWGLDVAQDLDDPIGGPMLRELLSDSKFFVAARQRLDAWAKSPQFESHFASATTSEELIASIKAMAESYRPRYAQRVSAMNLDPEVVSAVADYSRSQLTGSLFVQYLAAHNLRLTSEKGFEPVSPNAQLPPRPHPAER